ncbi:FUSC family protein [Ramlibacter sp. AW1]|uniref:FUSC family protein n=1 Tax=Ramlibacter aurantiacus TaxID=2801330 RepID=A0A936ZJU1_9BURK|nr:FUSC family protein [Ramlibacter aurantiacus]MBL0419056.1 FUSC family protein [Ramlibacter aurantiacus]
MSLKQRVSRELRQLASIDRSDRPWEMPVAAAVATGAPIFIGVAYGQLALGLVASLGALVFMHLPTTRLSHRMAWLMACAFGITACHALGLLAHLMPLLVVPLIAVITILATMVCRFYAAPPPGSLFFVMAAAIAAYSPAQGGIALVQLGAFALGTVWAVGVAFLYSLHIVSRRGLPQQAAPPRPEFGFVVLDSVVIGVFVGLSLLAAHALQLDRPYWVPVSCLAIIQGASLRAAWTRHLQRILGTAVGLLVFLAITQVRLDPWGIAAVLTLLTLLIETLVVRHYGLATVFITPLTILLAESGHSSGLAPEHLLRTRLVDTAVGAVVGLMGAACLHSPRFRAVADAWLRRLLPSGADNGV